MICKNQKAAVKKFVSSFIHSKMCFVHFKHSLFDDE